MDKEIAYVIFGLALVLVVLWLVRMKYSKRLAMFQDKLTDVSQIIVKDRFSTVSLLRKPQLSADEMGMPVFVGKTINAFDLLLGQANLSKSGHLIKLFMVLAILAPLLLLLLGILTISITVVFLFVACLEGIILFLVFSVRNSLRDKFRKQLPEALDVMVAALRAGHSLGTAVTTVGREISAPCGTEFAEVAAKTKIGVSVGQAMQDSSDKFDSDELELIAKAVALHAEAGGSLAELLDKVKITMREQIKLMRKVRGMTIQVRMSALIVAVIPILVAIIQSIVHPGFYDLLFTPEAGDIIMVIASLWLGGIIVMVWLSNSIQV